MKNIIHFITCGLFVISTTVIFAQNGRMASDDMDENGDEYIQEIKEKYLPNSKSLIIYKGDHKLSTDKRVDGDILVINGDLIVYGELSGRAVVTNGNIVVKRSGRIGKDAIAVNGQVIYGDESKTENYSAYSSDKYLDDEADAELHEVDSAPKAPTPPVFDNNWAAKDSYEKEMERFNREMEDFNRKMDKFNAKMQAWNEKMAEKNNSHEYHYDYTGEDNENTSVDDEDTHSASFVRVDNEPKDRWRKNRNSEGEITYFLSREPRYKYSSFFLFDYNRVDGLYLGLKLDRNHKIYSRKPFQIYGEAGYAFSEKAIRYQLGVDKVWGSQFRFTLGGELHDLTSTQDGQLVGDIENAVNALILKNDYRDYFRTLGYSFQASQNLNESLRLVAAYRVDDYSNMQNNVNWAVLFPKQDFRINPAIDEGHMVSYSGAVELNTVSTISAGKKHFKRVGWNILAEGERSRKQLNSDFDFTRYTLSVARYQPISRWENIDARIMVGAGTGDLPLQKIFSVGGISTLRGHSYKAFTGNQMALANVEYRVSSGILKDDKIFFIHPFSFILFMDSGYAWNNKVYAITDLYKGTHIGDFETDLGIGLGDEKNHFRFDIAKSVSEKNSDYKFNFRVNYAF
ncbi:BamA/TamA family outer membrane protein [bacterium]|nr:BamA/TamA family outer membrane protein [bacterium]